MAWYVCRHVEQQESTDTVVAGGGCSMAVCPAVLSRVIGTGDVGGIDNLHPGEGRARSTVTSCT